MRLSGLFILTFFGVYTEWLALFVAFYMGLFFFIKAFKNKLYFKHVSVLFSACVLAVGISVCQYSAIAGFEPLKERTVEKYVERSGMYKKHAQAGFAYGTKKATNKFFLNYESNYNSLLQYAWYMLFAAIALLLADLFNRELKIPASHLLLFCIVLLSIITHHLLFYNFTVLHDFSTLKSAIFFTLFIGYVIGVLFNYFDTKYSVFVSVFFTCVTAWFIYRSVQDYKALNKKDPDSVHQKVVGRVMAENGKTDEVMFTNADVTPYLWFYSQRGSIWAGNLKDCIDYLKIAEQQKGLFVKFENKNANLYISATQINVDGNSNEVYKKVIPLKELRSEIF
jgi:putative Mn2+ efflux pump MntP